jgi:hypothetical protein
MVNLVMVRVMPEREKGMEKTILVLVLHREQEAIAPY